jgi:uncharacterized surface protein with fasciclin (FAS1) repeats
MQAPQYPEQYPGAPGATPQNPYNPQMPQNQQPYTQNPQYNPGSQYNQQYNQPGQAQPQTGQQTQGKDPLAQNGLDVVLQKANLNMFESALRLSGMDSMLSQGGPYTVFAPTDNQIKNLPKSIAEKFFTNQDYAKSTLQNHVVQGQINQQNMNSTDFKTVAGNPISITKNGQDAFVNGQRIMGAAQFNNGIIYEIDGTLLPSQ